MNTKSVEALRKWREEHPEGFERGPQRNPMQKWMDNDTRKTAIEAFCWQCMGGSPTEATGLIKAIRECPCNGKNGSTACPLHAWRPYK